MRYILFLILLACAQGTLAATGDNLTLSLDGRWAHGPCWAVDSVGPVAYFGDGAHLRIVDYSGPSPVELGDILLPGPVRDVEVVGNLAYVANFRDGLRIVDISNPSAPTEVGSAPVLAPASGVAVVGSHAYLATQAGLRVIDISNPAAPFEVGSLIPVTDAVQSIAAFGNHVYSTGTSADVVAIDVSNPTMPVIVGRYDYSEPGYGITTDGDHVFVAHNHIINVLDFSDPTSPFRARAVALPAGVFATAVAIDGNSLFVAEAAPATLGQFQVYDWNPVAGSLSLVSTVATLSRSLAVSGGGGFAFVGDGDEGLLALDVSNTATPVEISRYDTAGQVFGAAIQGDLVYLADAGRGLHIIDAAQSPPTRIGHVQTADAAHRVIVQDDYAYVAAEVNGVVIIDVSDPTNPTVIGSLVSWALGIDLVGDKVYVACAVGGIRIYDVSNPAAPVQTSFLIPTIGTGRKIAANATHAFLAKTGAGISSIDVTDPFNPVEVDVFDFTDVFANAWDVALAGDYLYVADDYQARLRVIDVSDPTNLVEVFSVATPDQAHGVVTSEGNAYVAVNDAGVVMYDLINPAAPAYVGFFDTGHRAFSVAVSAATVVVADDYDGVWILDNGISPLSSVPPSVTRNLTLAPAHPNPFNPRTRIPLHLTSAGRVELTIHDVRGVLVSTVHVGDLDTGGHELSWDGRDDAGRAVASGMYMAKARTRGETQSVKLMLVR